MTTTTTTDGQNRLLNPPLTHTQREVTTTVIAAVIHMYLYVILSVLLHALLPQLLALQQCASRPLLSALSSLVVKYPTTTIFELLLPLIKNKKFGIHACVMESFPFGKFRGVYNLKCGHVVNL